MDMAEQVFQGAWRQLKRWLMYRFVIRGLFFVMVVIGLAFWRPRDPTQTSYVSGIFVLIFISMAFVAQLLGKRIDYWNCPRCKKPYFLDKISERANLNQIVCPHCGLRRDASS
jgi:DNA-directed RNA polymerase subunit RPC12/RpoP